MKKLFTLILSACAVLGAHAQVVMVDPSGKEYTAGQEMTITPEIDQEYGDVTFIGYSPKLKNTGASNVNVSLNVNIVTLPTGTSLSDCFSGSCRNYKETGSHTTSSKTIKAGETTPTEIEWNCWSDTATDYAYGQCTVDFTLIVDGVEKGVIRVNYLYADPTGIREEKVQTDEGPCYNLAGQKTENPARGTIYLQNGKKIMK